MKSSFDNRLQNNLFPEPPASFKRKLNAALETEGVKPRRVRPWAVAATSIGVTAVAASLVLVLLAALKPNRTQMNPPDTITSPIIEATDASALLPTPGVPRKNTTRVFQLAPEYYETYDHVQMPKKEQIAASILDFLYARGKEEPDELWILGVRTLSVDAPDSEDICDYALVLAQNEFGDDGFGGERGPELYCLSLPDGDVRWATDNSPIGPCQTRVEIDGQIRYFLYGSVMMIDEPGEPWVNRGAIKGSEPGSDIEFSMFQSYGKMREQLSESRYLGSLREYFLVRLTEHDRNEVSDSKLEFDTLEGPYTVDIADIPEIAVVTADIPAQKPYVPPTAQGEVTTRNLTRLDDEKAAQYLKAILDALRISGIQPRELWLCAAQEPALDPDPDVQKTEWRDESIDRMYLAAQFEFEDECGPALFYYHDNRIVWTTPGCEPYDLNLVHDSVRNQTIVFGSSCAFDGKPLPMEYATVKTDAADYAEYTLTAELPLKQVKARTEGSHGEPREYYLCVMKGFQTVLSFSIEADGRSWTPEGTVVDLTPIQIPYMAIQTEEGFIPGNVTHLVYATDLTENGVLAADGMPVQETLSAYQTCPTGMPQFSLDTNWKVVPCGDSVTVKGVQVYNEQLERLRDRSSSLKRCPPAITICASNAFGPARRSRITTRPATGWSFRSIGRQRNKIRIKKRRICGAFLWIRFSDRKRSHPVLELALAGFGRKELAGQQIGFADLRNAVRRLAETGTARRGKRDDRLAGEIVRFQKAVDDRRLAVPPDRESDKDDIEVCDRRVVISERRTRIDVFHFERASRLLIHPIEVGVGVRRFGRDLVKLRVDTVCKPLRDRLGDAACGKIGNQCMHHMIYPSLQTVSVPMIQDSITITCIRKANNL